MVLARPVDRESDGLRHQQDVAEHNQHQQRKDALVDDVGVEQHQQQGDFGDALGHQSGGVGVGVVQPHGKGAGEGPGEFAQQRHRHQRQNGQAGQVEERQVETQPGGGEEQRNEQPLGGAPHPRHDFLPQMGRQSGQRRAEQQRPQRAVQPDALGGGHYQEQPAQQHPESEMRHIQQPVQRGHQRRNQLDRQRPDHHGKAGNLPQQNQDALPAQRPGVGRRLAAAAVGRLADGETHQQQRQQFGDDDGGEDFQADGFFQQPLVGQHLGHQPQAAQRQDAGQGQGVGEIQPQGEIAQLVAPQIGGHHHRGAQRDEHRQCGGNEEAPPQGGDEAGDVDFVQADEEEEQEDAHAQKGGQIVADGDYVGDERPQQHAHQRIGED